MKRERDWRIMLLKEGKGKGEHLITEEGADGRVRVWNKLVSGRRLEDGKIGDGKKTGRKEEEKDGKRKMGRRERERKRKEEIW